MATITATSARESGMTRDEKFVIFASSLGTVFEWYDFYLYATLAPFFAALFFPPGNDTAALLSAFATYAAGFLVRPFGEHLGVHVDAAEPDHHQRQEETERRRGLDKARGIAALVGA